MGTSDLWNYNCPCSYKSTYSHVYFYTYIRALNPSIGGEGRVCTIVNLYRSHGKQQPNLSRQRPDPLECDPTEIRQ